MPDATECTLQAWFSVQVDEREIPILVDIRGRAPASSSNACVFAFLDTFNPEVLCDSKHF